MDSSSCTLADEGPPYDDPTYTDEDYTVHKDGLLYPTRYSAEILDMKNWIAAHPAALREYARSQGVDTESRETTLENVSEDALFDILEKAMYFTGKRAWMARKENRPTIYDLLSWVKYENQGGSD